MPSSGVFTYILKNKYNMSNLTQYHLVYVNENWTLKRAGAERATEIFYGKTKEEAIRLCSQRLQNSGSSLRIHNKNGQIEEERTYPRSADPRSSRG